MSIFFRLIREAEEEEFIQNQMKPRQQLVDKG